ncbi:hypothetical protein ACRAWG_36360 [Methylobacterium sp. P31]
MAGVETQMVVGERIAMLMISGPKARAQAQCIFGRNLLHRVGLADATTLTTGTTCAEGKRGRSPPARGGVGWWIAMNVWSYQCVVRAEWKIEPFRSVRFSDTQEIM